MKVEESMHRIRSFARSEGLTKGVLAARAGMRDTTLRGFDRPDWNPTATTLKKLEATIPASYRAAPPVPHGVARMPSASTA